MYDKLAVNDTLKEFLVQGADFDNLMPEVPKVYALPEDVVAFHDLPKEKHPRDKFVHFYVDDYRFQRVWNNPTAYLQQFGYCAGIISPDFSMTPDMPRMVQMWNCYRNRALTYWLSRRGFKVIPSVGWVDEDSFEWCFDGIPKGCTVSVSTNGCHSKDGKRAYLDGIVEMVLHIEPRNIVVVGKEISECNYMGVPVKHYKGHGQKIKDFVKESKA
jgi:hypothetical protein